MRLLEGREQASAMVEQQRKELTRNYQSALDAYNDLLKKKQDSAMAIDPAHQQEGEQFRVLDPPSLPTKRSEEHTSELQSRLHLVCRLLLEKKNTHARVKRLTQLHAY